MRLPISLTMLLSTVLLSACTFYVVDPNAQVTSPLMPSSSSTTAPQNGITAPVSDSTVTGNVDIVGTATREKFQFYTLEYVPQGQDRYDPNNFQPIGGGSVQVTTGSLGIWATDSVDPGEYILRLRIVDKDGNYVEYIVENIEVQ